MKEITRIPGIREKPLTQLYKKLSYIVKKEIIICWGLYVEQGKELVA